MHRLEYIFCPGDMNLGQAKVWHCWMMMTLMAFNVPYLIEKWTEAVSYGCQSPMEYRS